MGSEFKHYLWALRKYGCVVAMLFTLSGLVLALAVNVDKIDFGDSAQERGEEITKTVSVSSTKILRNLTWTFIPETGFTPGDFEIEVAFDNVNLSAGGSTDVDVKINAPESFDAVDEDLDEKRFDIGVLKIFGEEFDDENDTFGSSVSDEAEMTLQVENNLDIASVEVDTGDGVFRNVSGGATVNVPGGNDLEIKVNVRNRDEDNGEDLKGVLIRVDAEDLGDEDAEIEVIEPGDIGSERVEVGTDEGDVGGYDVRIEVEGDDEDDGGHGDKFEFKVFVEEPDGAGDEQQASPDLDSDGIENAYDNCPFTANLDQSDLDSDGLGDLCDAEPGTITGGSDDQEIERQQQIQNQLQQFQQQFRTSGEAEVDEENVRTDNLSSGDSDGDKGSKGLLPFMIGFVVGIMITAGFFILIRS